MGSKIENMTQDMMKISSITGTDTMINALLSEEGGDFAKDLYSLGSEDVIRINQVQNRISSIKNNFFNYNMHVWIFGADGLIYSALDQSRDDFDFKVRYAQKYQTQDWYRAVIESQGRGIWIAPFYYGIDCDGAQGAFISQARILRDSIRQEHLGIVMVTFGSDNFQKLLGEKTSGIITLLSEEGKLIFSSDSSKMESFLATPGLLQTDVRQDEAYHLFDMDGEKYLINEYSLDTLGWKLVSVVSYEDSMREIWELKRRTVQINTAAFAIFAIICICLILYITNPLHKLIRSMERKQVGGYSVGSMEKSDDVSNLVNVFSHLFNRIDDLMKTVLEEKQIENDLKYEALRSQINPHFLFNTLNSIKWSAIISGAEHVARMISSLGMILEVSISRGTDEISLGEELELVRSYLFIQNVRYYDKFRLETHVAKETLNAKVPKFILQPCVENSIIHGLGDHPEMTLCIEALYCAEGFLLELTDDGEGIQPERLATLISDLSHTQHCGQFSGIGLWNVNERIKLKYGKQYGITITSQPKQGTRIYLLLPRLDEK